MSLLLQSALNLEPNVCLYSNFSNVYDQLNYQNQKLTFQVKDNFLNDIVYAQKLMFVP